MHLCIHPTEGQVTAVAHVPVVGGLRFWRTPEGYARITYILQVGGYTEVQRC